MAGKLGPSPLVTGVAADHSAPFRFHVARSTGLEVPKEGLYERNKAKERCRLYFGRYAAEQIDLRCVEIRVDGPFTYFEYEARLL